MYNWELYDAYRATERTCLGLWGMVLGLVIVLRVFRPASVKISRPRGSNGISAMSLSLES